VFELTTLDDSSRKTFKKSAFLNTFLNAFLNTFQTDLLLQQHAQVAFWWSHTRIDVCLPSMLTRFWMMLQMT